jgi:hypothetical protein
MTTEGMHPELSHMDLGCLRRALDAACQELGIGMAGLDVPKRERLVECIVRLARQGESNVDALQKRAVIYVKNTERSTANKV